MKTIRVLIFVFLILSFLVVYSGAQRSASYGVGASTLAGGGGQAASPSYLVTYTISQPSPIGVSSSNQYTANSGFWRILGTVGGDMQWLPLLLFDK